MKLSAALTLSLSISLASLVGCAASGTDDGEGSAAALSDNGTGSAAADGGTSTVPTAAPGGKATAANEKIWESMRSDLYATYFVSLPAVVERPGCGLDPIPGVDGVFVLQPTPDTQNAPFWTKVRELQLSPYVTVTQTATDANGNADINFYMSVSRADRCVLNPRDTSLLLHCKGTMTKYDRAPFPSSKCDWM